MKQNPSISDFPSEMVTACNAALDAGVFYSDDFDEFVLQHMNGFGCEAVLMEIADVDGDHCDHCYLECELTKLLEAAVTASPRGYYAVIRTKMERCGTIFKTIVSDGSGSPASHYRNRHDDMPTSDKVIASMIEMEIFLCRKAIEDQRSRDLCLSAIKMHGLQVGYTHRGKFLVNGEHFSTVTISEILLNTGDVKLLMIKRGSKRRFSITVGAAFFVREANLIDQSKEQLFHFNSSYKLLAA